MEKIINIKNFNLSFSNNVIFNNFNFDVEKGSVAGLFGPTGCGKTSLLNKIVQEYGKNYKISYVFQDNKLIENLTALKNVSLPLENFMTKADAEVKAKEYLKFLKLESKINEKVSVLSGGERQRVNIARAFAYPCQVLLMDEPFSAQDNKNKNEIISLTKKIIDERNITAVIVSHNKGDLDALCNNIVNLGILG